MMAWAWRIGVFALALLVFAIARAPASVLMPQRPGVFTYDGVSGTVWDGSFQNVRLGGAYRADQMQWRLMLFDLAQGRVTARLTFAGGDIEGDAMLSRSWRGDRRISAQSLDLTGAPLGDAQLAGVTRIRALDITFADGLCANAAGQIESDLLARNAATLNWTGPNLSGAAQCAGDRALVTLDGLGAAEQVKVRVDLLADGAGRWFAEIGSRTQAVQIGLAAAGFSFDPGSETLSISKDMRWFPL